MIKNPTLHLRTQYHQVVKENIKIHIVTIKKQENGH